MGSITSVDGTRIGFRRSGTGPPLLLVHGATYDHTTAWRFVVPELERRFTVYAMDRRGRGSSGDSRGYELQREAEDVAAVVDAIGEPVNLFGHSYGALCALEAALLTPNLRRLILYEGVPLSGAAYYPPGMIEGLEALLEAGDVEGMLIAMMRDVIQRPPDEIALLRSHQEDWDARLRNAPTIPREMRGEQGYVFSPDRFTTMRTPTLLLVGGESPPGELNNAKGVSDGLPDAKVVILPGQRHTAMITAPEVLIKAVVRFLGSSRGRAPDRTSPPGQSSGYRSLLLAGAVVLLSATGCSSGSTSHPSFTVTDSAGIEIVHSVRPAWTGATAWRVTPEPRLQIGERSGADPYMLDRVMGVTVLDNGGVAIAHMGDNTVRFYDADGTFVRKVGGHGGGPQEFQQITGLARHGDEIWGRQFGPWPAKVFDQAGNFLRAESADIPAGMRAGGVHGVFGDGSLFIADSPQSGEETPRPRLGMSTLVRQAGERTDTLAVVPAVRILPWPGRPGGVHQEFGPTLTLAVAGDRFYHAFPEEYEIIVRDTTGAVRRIIRRDWDPVRVTGAHIAGYAEAQLDMAMEGGGEVPPQLRAQRQSIVDAQVHPEHHPAFARLVISRTGHLWAERLDPDHPKTRTGWHMLRDTPTTWDVFDPNGVWLGAVDLPPRFSPYEFGAGYVAGVWRDDLDVEFVRVYGLDR